jgi:hypothetical protein
VGDYNFRKDNNSQRAAVTPLAIASIDILKRHAGLPANVADVCHQIELGRRTMERAQRNDQISPIAVDCISSAYDLCEFLSGNSSSVSLMRDKVLRSIESVVRRVGPDRLGFFWRDPFYCVARESDREFATRFTKIMNRRPSTLSR